MGCTTNQRRIPFEYFLHLLFRVNEVHFCVFCSLRNWSWQSRRQGVMGYTNGWCTDTLGTVLNKSLRYCLFQWWSFLLIISKTCYFGVTTHYMSLSWGSWIHFTPAHPDIHFSITILPSNLCLKSSKRSLSFRFSHKNLVHISVPSHLCHMPHMYDPPWFYNHNIWW